MTENPSPKNILPVGWRAGWDILVNSSTAPNQTISFYAKVPISWIILVSYGYVLNDPDRLGNAPTKCWFRGDVSGGSPQFYYTSFDYFGANESVFRNQSVVPYMGRAYKVYGKEIVVYLQLVSGFRSQMIVNAYPQIYGAAQLEIPPEFNQFMDENTDFTIPDWASHIAPVNNMAGDGIFINFYDRTAALLLTVQVDSGTYIPMPFNAVSCRCTGGDGYFNYRFFGGV